MKEGKLKDWCGEVEEEREDEEAREEEDKSKEQLTNTTFTLEKNKQTLLFIFSLPYCIHIVDPIYCAVFYICA